MGKIDSEGKRVGGRTGRKKWKRALLWCAGAVAAGAAALALCDLSVAWQAAGKTYDDADSVPHRRVGLVLGTSPVSRWGARKRNLYFDYRIDAAAELYRAGKVDWLVVSGGDYRATESGYDEPVAMRDSLIRHGVDSARIILDYDGTRTLNSIAKMRDVYCQDSIILISQKYHNERALYQAKYLGVNAIGYNARTPGGRSKWLRNRGREVLSRAKLYLDMARGLKPDFKHSAVDDFANSSPEVLDVAHISTPHGDLLRMKPDMTQARMDMVCGQTPSVENDSIILIFAGAFTGKAGPLTHSNIAGDHVAGGKRYAGYACERCNGAFTWSEASGPRFFYKTYEAALDSAALEGGMGFTQKMMIHQGHAVKTTRPAGNTHTFRALCLDEDGELAIYESQGRVKFGDFISALLSQGVQEALYTDMGGWDYSFYRKRPSDRRPTYLHGTAAPTTATNFIVVRMK